MDIIKIKGNKRIDSKIRLTSGVLTFAKVEMTINRAMRQVEHFKIGALPINQCILFHIVLRFYFSWVARGWLVLFQFIIFVINLILVDLSSEFK
jgi:hypothetical protein